MNRSAIGKAIVLALASALASAAAVSCSTMDSSSEKLGGTVGLNLEIAPGVNVNSVHYEITGNGITAIVGDIPVADAGSTVSALINGIPAGAGYVLKLTAVSTDGKVTCAGQSTFAVVAGQSTSVTVPLQCTAAATSGSVVIDATFNQCPVVTSLVALPLQVAVGKTIALTAAASDGNATDVLTYAWSATAGTFTSATTANTTFNCTAAAAGSPVLTLTVSDGKCPKTATVQVRCVPLQCGNGVVDSGETCDPPGSVVAGVTCPTDCTLPVCGDGIVEAPETCDDHNTANQDNCPSNCVPSVCGDHVVTGTETCDPAGTLPTAGCDINCHIVTGCGNGVVEAPETCDDGNVISNDGCSSTCRTERCGDGIVQTSEQCDPPGATLPTATCDATCHSIVAACTACEGTSCSAQVTACAAIAGTATAGPGTGTARSALCQAVIDCERTSNCAAATIQTCYCGAGVNPIACVSGAAAGVCKAQWEAAAESTDALTVSARFTNPAFASGVADQLLVCDQTSCSTQCFPFH